MSKFYEAADTIKTFLESVSGLETIPFVVNRQRDIASELKSAIGKQAGCIVIIDWAGAPNEDLTADGPRFNSRFTVSLFSKPVIRKDQTPADDIIETIAIALHDHRLGTSDHFRDRLVVTGIDSVDHPELLIYRINLTTPSQL